jgi:hypothetical protein
MWNRKRPQDDLMQQEKIAVLTPIPNPRESTTTKLSKGAFAKLRKAKRMRATVNASSRVFC